MNPSVKVAQPGWSADTAPDYKLVFNSDWPSLQIAFETLITQETVSPVAHNLGYPPLVIAYSMFNGFGYGRTALADLTVDNQNIYFTPGFLNAGLRVILRCYNVDISQEANYPLPQGSAGPTAPDLTTSIKIVKPNRNIESINMNDFILNSQCQSPAVLHVATQSGPYFTAGTNDSINIPLQTQFIPWSTSVFMTQTNPATYNISLGLSNISFLNNTASITWSPGLFQGASLIILRDPLFYPNVVKASF